MSSHTIYNDTTYLLFLSERFAKTRVPLESQRLPDLPHWKHTSPEAEL